MIAKIAKMMLACLMLLASGCMNLYVRCPGTSSKIEKTYQCTQESFAWSYIIMFPQTMGYGNSKGLVVENIFTIPLGCICFVDVACEVVADTVLWPIDKMIISSREDSK